MGHDISEGDNEGGKKREGKEGGCAGAVSRKGRERGIKNEEEGTNTARARGKVEKGGKGSSRENRSDASRGKALAKHGQGKEQSSERKRLAKAQRRRVSLLILLSLLLRGLRPIPVLEIHQLLGREGLGRRSDLRHGREPPTATDRRKQSKQRGSRA